MSSAAERIEVTPESPWLGLHSFAEATQKYFFGRDDELRDLFRRVEHKTLTVIFGKSGLGKTSLLHAGLIPRLREAGYVQVAIRLGYANEDLPLSQQVIKELRAALHATGLDDLAGFTSEPISFWELFHDPIHGMIRADGSPAVRVVLIFDQFEEIYTLGEHRRADAQDFQEALAELVENRVPESFGEQIQRNPDMVDRIVFEEVPCKVVISMREDFLSRLERWRSAMPSLMDNRVELRPLSGPKAAMAVFSPGLLREGKPPIVTMEAAATIVRFVAGAQTYIPLAEIDAIPPLLSLVCAEMNSLRLAAGREQIDPEQLKDRSADILEDFYIRCFSQAPSGLRELVEDHLLSPEGHRESLAFDTARAKLEEMGKTAAAGEEALATLVNARLLVVEERNGVRRIELTHDILTGIARRSRDQRREREAAEKAEKEKLEAQRIAEEQRRAIRRARTIAAAFVLLFLAALGALIWALALKNQADRATAEAKKAVAVANGAVAAEKRIATDLKEKLRQASRTSFNQAERQFVLGKWDEGIALLARAVQFDPKNEIASESFFQQLISCRWKVRTPLATFRHEDSLWSAVFSPDGSRILTASNDKTARLWDATSGKLLATLRHESPVYSAVFGPDGTQILTATNESARLWDAISGNLIATFRHGGPAYSRPRYTAVFSPNAESILTSGGDHPRLWDRTSGKLKATFFHADYVDSAVFSPDGKRILTADQSTARLLDANSWGKIATFDDVFNSYAIFSPDGTRILTTNQPTGDTPANARLWDASSGKLLASFHQNGYLNSAVFSPDGARILTAGVDRTARLWDSPSGKLTATFAHEDDVDCAVFSPDGARILTASADKTADFGRARRAS